LSFFVFLDSLYVVERTLVSQSCLGLAFAPLSGFRFLVSVYGWYTRMRHVGSLGSRWRGSTYDEKDLGFGNHAFKFACVGCLLFFMADG
jgi:hypothetical protein